MEGLERIPSFEGGVHLGGFAEYEHYSKMDCMARGKILVVDPDKLARKLIKETLTKEGYEVLDTEDGAEWLKTMNAGSSGKARSAVNLILCHHQVPDLNGGHMINKFLSQCHGIPIVMLADRPDLHYAAQMFRQGVVEYLVKPLQPRILVDVVRKVIEVHGQVK